MTHSADFAARTNRRIARWLGAAAVLAFGFGFALVPLYDVFCRLTGIGGRPVDARAASDQVRSVDYSRDVTVELMATVMPGASASLQPRVPQLRLHPGQLVTATYRVSNPTNATFHGQAVPSVSPASAARFLHKVDCFCFAQQSLAPGESRELPVTFYVSPELPARETSITLSYAFYPVQRPGRQD